MSFWPMYCLIGEQLATVQTMITGLLRCNFLLSSGPGRAFSSVVPLVQVVVCKIKPAAG
jgi:hypothetical protein